MIPAVELPVCRAWNGMATTRVYPDVISPAALTSPSQVVRPFTTRRAILSRVSSPGETVPLTREVVLKLTPALIAGLGLQSAGGLMLLGTSAYAAAACS
jgi:hypothetical protein